MLLIVAQRSSKGTALARRGGVGDQRGRRRGRVASARGRRRGRQLGGSQLTAARARAAAAAALTRDGEGDGGVAPKATVAALRATAAGAAREAAREAARARERAAAAGGRFATATTEAAAGGSGNVHGVRVALDTVWVGCDMACMHVAFGTDRIGALHTLRRTATATILDTGDQREQLGDVGPKSLSPGKSQATRHTRARYIVWLYIQDGKTTRLAPMGRAPAATHCDSLHARGSQPARHEASRRAS